MQCHCCGRRLSDREDSLHILKNWNYFSNKDGQIDEFYVCEYCYDRWVQTFVCPPVIKEQTEFV